MERAFSMNEKREIYNHLDQPIGFPIDGWQACESPPRSPMVGRYCKLVPLELDAHATQLYEAFAEDKEHRLWTYLPYGPFDSFEAYFEWMKLECTSADPLFYTVIDPETAKAVGVASYLSIEPDAGVIEVGHINYSPRLQKTRAATEVMYLMMRRVFDELGYRRYEWRCDALNKGSRRAAKRFGFVFEGIFRQAVVNKRRNRDTAWHSILDKEWGQMKKAFEHWLDSGNFDSHGKQIKRLSDFGSAYCR